MSTQIRPLRATDLPSVSRLFDLYRQFYRQAPDQAKALHFISERFHQHESVVLVAEESAGGLAGFCQMYPSFCSVEAAPIYTLYDLFVLPNARGSGVGRKLLLAAEAKAKADGKVRLDLTTDKTNLRAQTVYESLGWVRDELFFAYSRRINTVNQTP